MDQVLSQFHLQVYWLPQVQQSQAPFMLHRELLQVQFMQVRALLVDSQFNPPTLADQVALPFTLMAPLMEVTPTLSTTVM